MGACPARSAKHYRAAAAPLRRLAGLCCTTPKGQVSGCAALPPPAGFSAPPRAPPPRPRVGCSARKAPRGQVSSCAAGAPAAGFTRWRRASGASALVGSRWRTAGGSVSAQT